MRRSDRLDEAHHHEGGQDHSGHVKMSLVCAHRECFSGPSSIRKGNRTVVAILKRIIGCTKLLVRCASVQLAADISPYRVWHPSV